MNRIFIIAFLSLLCGLTALADTLWVDVNDTTKIQSIKEAVDSASAGDIIMVANGSYYEDTLITIENKNGISIIGENVDSCLIAGSGLYPEFLIKIESDSVTLKYLAMSCVIMDYKGLPTLSPVILWISGICSKVTRCDFHDGLYGAHNRAIYVDSLSGGQIDSCNFLSGDIIITMGIGSDSLHADYNYWSSTDSATIEDIYIDDGKDNQNAGYVKFVPFSQSEF